MKAENTSATLIKAVCYSFKETYFHRHAIVTKR